MIESGRLRLPCLGVDVLRALIARDYTEAGRLLGARVPHEVLALEAVFELRLDQLERTPALEPWLTRALVLKSEQRMIGVGGFHGPPGAAWLDDYAQAAVEFGYTVFERDRRRGYATEAGRALLDWGRARGVQAFALSIGPGNAASLRLAGKLGFAKAGEWVHEERGLEHVYLLRG